MKKLLLLFVGLALCLLSTEAKDISPAQAKMIASKYVKIGAKQIEHCSYWQWRNKENHEKVKEEKNRRLISTLIYSIKMYIII